MRTSAEAAVSIDPGRGVTIEELHRRYLDVLLVGAGIAALFTGLRALNWRPGHDMFFTWPVAAVLLTGIVLTCFLRGRHAYFASWLFVLSLVLSSALETQFFPGGLAPWLFSSIVVMASLLLPHRDGPVIDAVILAIQLAAFVKLGLPWLAMRAPILLTLTSSAVAWLGTRQLHTVLEWEWSSTQHAMLATEEAQRQRAELSVLNKELESAYQRLERLNHMLILARQEAEEARLLKTQFANAVSHELRSPLNLIIGFSEMMVNSPEVYGRRPWPERLRNHIQQIYQSSQHLSQLIDDVLDVGRIDAYRLALNRAPASIPDIIAEAIAIMGSMYKAHHLYLRTDCAPDLPPVTVDRTRIRQVLLNLLTNALRFTENGGVTVRATLSGHEVVIQVCDTGVGISPADLPHLFNEFQQFQEAPYRWHRGSGLGLAVSKQLLEAHGGRIWAESTPGEGSVFSFTIPLEPDGSVEGLHHSPQELQFWASMQREAQSRTPIVAWTVPAGRRVLASHLASCDVTWPDTEAALERALSDVQPVALVCWTDGTAQDVLNMPLLQRHPGMPIILLSLAGPTREVSRDGFADYLVKPVSRGALEVALRRLHRPLANVLIVDDEAPMRDFLATALGTLFPGCECWQAATGLDAVNLLARKTGEARYPDAILLDLGLPDGDGGDWRVRMETLLAAQGEVPILAVTARDWPSDAIRSRPDIITYARWGPLDQREIERVLGGILAAVMPDPPASPSAPPARSTSVDGGPAS